MVKNVNSVNPVISQLPGKGPVQQRLLQRLQRGGAFGGVGTGMTGMTPLSRGDGIQPRRPATGSARSAPSIKSPQWCTSCQTPTFFARSHECAACAVVACPGRERNWGSGVRGGLRESASRGQIVALAFFQEEIATFLVFPEAGVVEGDLGFSHDGGHPATDDESSTFVDGDAE